MADYYVAPKSSFDATADAIREKTGSSADIEWTQNGFADAIDEIEGGADYKEVVMGTITNFISEDITTLAPNLFRGNSTVKNIECPNVTRVESELCRGASNLENISFNSVTYIGGNAFMQCPKLTTPLVFPSLNSGATSGLSNIANVPAIDMLGGFKMNSYFQNNSAMTVLILRASVLSGLGNINVFNGTPFASSGTGGTLYVPNDLIASYQSATNWSTILGYTNNQIKSIESTHTDPNADIDLTLYYADGTIIPTT